MFISYKPFLIIKVGNYIEILALKLFGGVKILGLKVLDSALAVWAEPKGTDTLRASSILSTLSSVYYANQNIPSFFHIHYK